MPKFTSVDIEIKSKDNTAKGIKSAKKGIGGLTKAVKSYGAEIGAAVAAVYGAIKVAKNLTDAYSKQEDAVTKLDGALRATGAYTPELSKEIRTLASELQRTTIYGDEVTLSATSLLQSLGNLNAEGLKQAIPLVQDLAAGMHMDLDMAASLVGKTLGSTTNALSRYGIVLDATADPSEKLAQLTEQINSKFGGMSEALGSTFQGRMTRMKNAFGDIKEILGAFIVEQAEPFMTWLLDFLQNGKNIEIISRVVKGFGATIVTVFGLAINYVKTLVEYYKIWGNAAAAVGKIVAVAFNPKKWGKGEMKAAIRDLTNYTVEAAKKIYDNWETYVVKTYKRWNSVLNEDVIPTIESANNSYSVLAEAYQGVANEADKTTAAIEEQTEAIKEQEEEYVAGYFPALQSMSDMVTAYRGELNKTTEATQELNNQNIITAEMLQGALNEAWLDFANNIQNSNNIIRDFIKSTLSGLLKAIGEQLIAMAAMYTISLQFGKAAVALAAGIAAIAAANAVKGWQQGGIIEAQQGYGGGDVVPAMLEPGERVIPKEVVRNNEPALNAMLSGQGMASVINVYLDGKKLQGVITKWTENGQLRISPRAVR